MFSTDVLGTDSFMSLPPKAQVLYVQLGLAADDEGFLSNPLAVVRASKCRRKDVETLVQKGYVIWFPSGVLVIRDWYKNNVLRKDRCTPTVHKEEREQLGITTQNQYFLTTSWQPNDNQSSTTCCPSGDSLPPQYNVTKDNLTKEKEVKKDSATDRQNQESSQNSRKENNATVESFPNTIESLDEAATEAIKKAYLAKIEKETAPVTIRKVNPEVDEETAERKREFQRKAAGSESATPTDTA